MAKVTAAQWLAKWGTNLNAAGTYIKNGVNAVQVAPGVTAAAAQDRMLAGIQAAVSSGLWARKVSGVSLADWQSAMVNKGIPHIAAGVAQAQKSKVQQITALLSAIDATQASIASLPKGGLQNNINRAVAWMQNMSANAPKRQGG